ncbi:MAG: PAS domain S-box protein [Desulfotignum sp.]|nr:PAS domain S-box protein [Desulfotignum sp.]MCF8139082.1 PAS domain S-box protein [Desulfotignum sp.]
MPTYKDLENRVAELEHQVRQHEADTFQKPVHILSVLMEAFRYTPVCKTFEAAAKKIFYQCKRLTGARSGYVALLSENGTENDVLFLDAGGMPCDVDPDLPMPIRGLRERAYKTKEVAFDNAFSESPWMKFMPEGHVRLDNVLFAPLNIDNKTVGVIGIANKPGGFNEQDVHISKIMGDLAAVALTYARSQSQLKNSEALFRTIFEQAAVGIAQVTPDGRFTKVNARFADITGYSKDELTRMNFAEITYPEDLNTESKSIDRVLKREIDGFEIEKRYIHKSGQLVWIKLYSNVVRDEKENIQFAVASVIDITERKIAETNREKFQEQLDQAQKMESIGSLAGGIAHDFNNLLFPIVGLSEMMLDDFPPDSPEHHDLYEIFKAGKRGRELVQQILSFSRQSEHRLILVHIQKILKEVLKLCRATIPADIPITQDIMTDCGPVMADPTQIHQIAMNLITNAFHAVEPVGGTITVTLRQVDFSHRDDPAVRLVAGCYAVLSITDTGTGIDPAVMNKIFDPYFTTKGKGRGTGLGLATVYGIVKAHGGNIRVHSEVGKGSSFDVYLPVAAKKAAMASEKQQYPLLTGTEHILLVDDEAPIVHMEKQMLERLGYRIASFTSSTDALAAFKTDSLQFDLVVTDMNMPDVNGMLLAKKLIAIRPEIPIIICTGFSERINKENVSALGIKGLLMKPLVMSDLAHKIREVLDSK